MWRTEMGSRVSSREPISESPKLETTRSLSGAEFIVLYKFVLTFKSVDEILECHSCDSVYCRQMRK